MLLLIVAVIGTVIEFIIHVVTILRSPFKRPQKNTAILKKNKFDLVNFVKNVFFGIALIGALAFAVMAFGFGFNYEWMPALVAPAFLFVVFWFSGQILRRMRGGGLKGKRPENRGAHDPRLDELFIKTDQIKRQSDS